MTEGGNLKLRSNTASSGEISDAGHSLRAESAYVVLRRVREGAPGQNELWERVGTVEARDQDVAADMAAETWGDSDADSQVLIPVPARSWNLKGRRPATTYARFEVT